MERTETRQRERHEFGDFVVADLNICHDNLTIKGTRILVEDVLFYVSEGHDWDWISRAYDGKVSHEANSEAVRLASEALVKSAKKRRTKPSSR